MEQSIKDILADDFWIMPATPEYIDEGVPYITSKNIKNGIIDFTKVNYISQDAYENISKNRPILVGDILISMIGTLGETAEVKESDGSFYGQNMFLVRLDQTKINKRYFLNFFKSNCVKRALEGKQNQSTQKYLKANHIEDLIIPVPALDEQKLIAEQLDKLACITALRNEELKYLDDLIKARFVKMFGEPIANPKGWPVKTLKELSTLITNGNTPKGGSENYVDSGIIFLRSQNVWRNRIELDDVAYIDEDTHASMKKSSLHHQDILITKTGRINTENSSLGRAALFLGEDDSANINGHVYLVRLTDEVVPEYVVTILTGEAYRKYIRKVCVGGIDKRQINVDQVEDFPIIMPPIEQQREFAEFRTQVDKSKVEVQKALDETQKLFDSLMQEYFG